MDFLKQNWATLIVIVAVAAYLGISLGTNQCPLCVVSNIVADSPEAPASNNQLTEVIGEQNGPSWQGETLTGRQFGSEASKGKVSMLVYWATWCAPCRDEIPSLITLRNEFPESELEIIGISLDEISKNIEPFAKANHINYELARNNQSLDDAFGPIRYIPTIVILDRQGRVQQRFTGLVGYDALHGQIERLVSEDRLAGM